MLYYLIGLLVGIVTLIPGVSGGTILVIFHVYDEITFKINNIYQNKKINWLNLKDIITLVIGIILGILFFAKIIEFLFRVKPNETMLFFIGIILFSLPNLTKNNYKFNGKYFLLGGLLILLLSFLQVKENFIIYNYPPIDLAFLFYFFLMGTIDGTATIIPGISGSMVMMILGPYYLLKSYLANLSFANLNFLIPLSIYYLGDLLGVLLGSKLYLFLNKLNQNKTTNTLLGLMLMSAIILIPHNLIFNYLNIISYLMVIFLSYICTQIINLITN